MNPTDAVPLMKLDLAQASSEDIEWYGGSSPAKTDSPVAKHLSNQALKTESGGGNCFELLAAYCAGRRPRLKDQTYIQDNPYVSPCGIRRARKLLGWEPQPDRRDPQQTEL